MNVLSQVCQFGTIIFSDHCPSCRKFGYREFRLGNYYFFSLFGICQKNIRVLEPRMLIFDDLDPSRAFIAKDSWPPNLPNQISYLGNLLCIFCFLIKLR